MTMSARENMLRMMRWEEPEYVPLTDDANAFVGFGFMAATDEPMAPGLGYDGFGVPWKVDALGGVPDNTQPPLLDDICDWEEKVTFPDLDAIDFKAMAAVECANIDRENKVVVHMNAVGPFERLVALMGYEEGLIALASDPDECRDFFEAFTDYKVELAKRIIDAYRPDTFYYYDDIANANNLFMSPETYRELIKPYHARVAKAVRERDVIYIQHCCGHCEEVVPDFVEFGAQVWDSAQPMNDLVGIQERFRGKLVVEGGWQSQGRPGMLDATEEEVREETKRCMLEYGKHGGYNLMPVMVNEKGPSYLVGDDRMPALIETWKKYRYFD